MNDMKKFYLEFELDSVLGPVEESMIVDAPDKLDAQNQCNTALRGFKKPRFTNVYELVKVN
jgi:hypothetical protein